MTQKLDGRRGTLSDNVASTGANTSWEHTPTAFSSIPLHSCCQQTQVFANVHSVFHFPPNVSKWKGLT
jgi:hypothetical protein